MHKLAAFSLEGQTALITGGGTGLGFGIASSFVQAGARVVLVGRRENVLNQAVAQLGDQATYRVHDITDFDRNHRLIDEIESSIGPIHSLVNNAGIHLKKSALETTEAEFQAVIGTHLTGAFSVTRAVAPRMVERRRGSLLFIASMASFIGMPHIVAYTTAKTAYLGVVRALAAELSPQGIRVNAIAPGWIRTSMLDQALSGDEERKHKILSRTLMNRFGDPDDVGHAAIYLSSPAAKFVTGTVLVVDGGASVGF